MSEVDDAIAPRTAIEPTVGMGVTMAGLSDRLAGTVQEVFAIDGDVGITCTIDQCLPDGSYRTRDDGERHSFRRRNSRPDGPWDEVHMDRQTQRWRKSRAGLRLTLGERKAYRDPHF
jgi:hypothetical protein